MKELSQEDFEFYFKDKKGIISKILEHPCQYDSKNIDDITLIKDMFGGGMMDSKNAIAQNNDFFEIRHIIARRGTPCVQIVDPELQRRMFASAYCTEPVYILAFLCDIYVDDAKILLEERFDGDLRKAIIAMLPNSALAKTTTLCQESKSLN